jgi:FkbM family methyltransferase
LLSSAISRSDARKRADKGFVLGNWNTQNLVSYRSLLKRVAISLGLYPAFWRLSRYLLRRHDLLPYRSDLSFFRQFIREDDLVFDVGASYGVFTEVFLDLGATVIACEPQPDCLKELLARHRRNDRLVAINCALGETRRRAKFYVRDRREVSGLIENWHPHHKIENVSEVEVVTLDDLIAEYGIPSYCKIDVEGYEYKVLEGLSKIIPLISLEYHLGDHEKSRACLNYLSRFGELDINVTSGETLRFLFEEWVSKEYFIEFLTKHLEHLSGFSYGDIFIRCNNQADARPPQALLS